MTDPLLDIRAVSFSYGAQQALKSISFSVDKGQYVSLIGPNGSGKTTLFNIIGGYFKPLSGEVLFCGRRIGAIPIRERAKKIAAVLQRQDTGFPFSCLEMVLLGLYPHNARFEAVTAASMEQVRNVMEATDVWRFANKPITELSGGELQRVILARALVQKPQLLLLDEAASELDISARIETIKLIKSVIKDTDMAVLSISHDLDCAYRYCDFAVALNNGSIAAIGEPQDVFSQRLFREVFFVEAEILPQKGFVIHDSIKMR